MKKRGKIIAILAVLAVLILGAAWFALKPQPTTVITASDYQVIEKTNFSTKVALTGNIAPTKTASLFTHLTGPVDQLHVQVGDRVNEQQLVAHIDVSGLERDLNRQLAEQNSTAVGAGNQIEQAQTQYSQYKETLDRGLNSQINTAESAMRTADDQFNTAVAEFENHKANHHSEIQEQDNAVNAARTQALAASINAVRSGVDVALALGVDGDGRTALGQAFTGADALNQLDGANRVLMEQQETYLLNLAKIDQQLAASQRAVASAFESKREAATGLESARLAANQQLESYDQAIQQANRAAQAGNVVSQLSTSQLRYDISSAEIRAPFAGVVTRVDVEQGKPAAGAVVAVGDDSKLLVKADIKEVDVPKIAVGQPVEFTTVATGTKKFSGRVANISTVANNATPAAAGAEGAAGAAAAAGGAGAANKVTFPIDIEVVGDRDGLLIGGSAKANVLTEQKNNVLTVPRDAVYTNDDGNKSVLVLDAGIVTERRVDTGPANDVDIVVTSAELRDGDTVLTQPENYRHMIGHPAVTE